MEYSIYYGKGYGGDGVVSYVMNTAQILLSQPFTYTTSPTNTAQVVNKGTGDNIDNYSGKGKYLNVTQNVEVPIHNNGGANSYLTYHDLDTNEVIQLGNSVDGGSSKELVTNGTFDTDSDWYKGDGWTISDNTATIDNTQTAYTSLTQSNLTTIGKVYITSFDLYLISGVIQVKGSNVYGTLYPTDNGRVTFVFVADSATFRFTAFPNTGAGSLGSIDNISVKEILPNSTTYNLTDKKFNSVLTHKTPFDTASQEALQANPNLIVDLATNATGTIPELNITLDSTDAFYACDLEGKYVVDARAGYGDEIEKTQLYRMLNSDETAIVTPIQDGEIDLEISIVGTSNTRPSFGQRLNQNFDQSKLYYIDVSWELISGTAIFQGLYVGGGTTNHGLASTTLSVVGETFNIRRIVQPDQVGAGDNFIATLFDGRNLFKVKTFINSVREATAQEISNYTSTCDLEQLNKGIQMTGIETDGIVPTGVRDDVLVYHPNQDLVLPMTPPQTHTMTKNIKHIEGSDTEVTITHEDDTTLVIGV